MNPNILRALLIIISTVFFVAGFVIASTSYQPVYNLSINFTIAMQTSLHPSFAIPMNIVSNVFNPVVCAGYILVLYLLTSRKLEVIAFLIWFLFLSWIVSILKQVYQQPRPFWLTTQVKMLEWTCYTQYGNPSGHSVLVIVLLDFFVRFGCRWHQRIYKLRILFYGLVLLAQLTVMLSRVYLGMHSLNQVMFGFMIGAYSLIPYYLYVQKWMFGICIWFLGQGRKPLVFLSLLVLTIVMALQQVLLTYLPHYEPSDQPNNPWITTIMSHPRCQSSYKYFSSFYLRCFADQAIAFGIPAFLLSLSTTHNGYTLLKKLSYPRLSLKFLGYLATIVAISLVPVLVFLNPFWKNVQVFNMGAFLWGLHGLGISLGVICLVAISPYLLRCFKLDTYDFQSYYNDYKVSVDITKTSRQQAEDPVVVEPTQKEHTPTQEAIQNDVGPYNQDL